MKIYKFILGALFCIIGILGCSKDKDFVDIEKILINGSWIRQNFCMPEHSDRTEEYMPKDKYTFYDNGKYNIERVGVNIWDITDDMYYLDTILIEGIWKYDSKNKIIDFIGCDTSCLLSMINDSTIQCWDTIITPKTDWEIIEINENRFIVKYLTNDPNIILKGLFIKE